MLLSRWDASQGELKADPGEAHLPGAGPEARPVTRPLVVVTLALMAGMAAPAWGLHLPEPWLVAAGVGLWAALALLWWQRRLVRFLPLIFFALLGVAFYQQARQPDFPPGHLTKLHQHQNLILFGHLNRPGKLGGERVQLFMEAFAWRSPWGWRPAAGKVLVLAPIPEPPPVGTGLVVRGHLAPPRMLLNPGTFNRPRYLAADGLFREMRLSDPQRLLFLAETQDYPWGERLRGGIRELLKGIDPAGRAIYLAMLLGDQGEVTPAMRQNFSRTGTSHLLVINGLHLGMVAAVTYFLSFWLLRRFPRLLLRVNAVKIATLLAAIPVVFYAWVAGGSPSTQRAEVMVLAYLLLVFLGRPGEVWSALALAALVILSLTPLRLFTTSFQLSFVAVAALIYILPRLVGWIAGPRSDHPITGPAARLFFRIKEWFMVSVVATLATAPLAAFYFQVVSLLGILVNVVAIPLVLLLALPLGEAAVISQALSLTPVAQALVFVGKLPLWLGYQVIEWGAKVPGSAIIVPTPTWLMIGAYYAILILVFYPRRSYLTWAGAALAGMVLVTAAALPLATAPQALEVTCLDAYGGLEGVVVSPENRRLVVSAAVPPRWGRPGPGWGPLPGYCHWRQFRRLDLAIALNLNEANAGELLSLGQQFSVGSYWYGRRDREGPAAWDLWNYLGDRGATPRSLARGSPPVALGGVDLRYVKLGADEAPALEVAYEGQRVLMMPPVGGLAAEELPAAAGPLAALVIPATLVGAQERTAILARLNPGRVVVYGDPARSGAALSSWPVPCQFTREGAVSLYLAASGVTARQWRPQE
ncbi:MAG: ComEC/Rec2 family competence protein [Desulfobaccales bacterium]